MNDIVDQAWKGWKDAALAPDLSPETLERLRDVWFSSAYFMSQFLLEMRTEAQPGDLEVTMDLIHAELTAWRGTLRDGDPAIMIRILKATKQ